MRFVFGKRFVGLIAAAVVLVANAAAPQTRAVASRARATAYTGTIAFVRDGQGDSLNVIHADGSGLRRITPPGTDVSEYKWSPNGRLIAYIDGRGSLWLVRPDGTGLRRLLSNSKLASTGLSWSPSGRKIAITSPGAAGKVKTTDCVGLTIYLVSIHGSPLRKLRDTSAMCDDPAWSPRGDEIAYGSQDYGLSGSIWVIHPDGSGDRQVSRRGTGPHWSSDGRQIAFSVAIPSGIGTTCVLCAFAVVNSTGRNFHVVTKQAYTEYGEVWSPHGRRILYGRANSGGIGVIGSDGRNGRQVTTDSPAESLAPKLAWSPNGGAIVYAASTGGLYEVGVNGRGKVQLTGPQGGDLDPSWVISGASDAASTHTGRVAKSAAKTAIPKQLTGRWERGNGRLIVVGARGKVNVSKDTFQYIHGWYHAKFARVTAHRLSIGGIPSCSGTGTYRWTMRTRRLGGSRLVFKKIHDACKLRVGLFDASDWVRSHSG